MGRHRLRPVPSATGPRHAARPSSGRRVRGATPMTLAAALLVAAPGGVAFAADDPPPAPVDDAGTALGGALGTDSGSDSGADSGSDDAPVTGADVVEESGAAEEEDAAVDETAADAATAGERSAAEVQAADSGATDVTLQEKNGSGVTGTATIDAESVVATATGLDPDEQYVSFFYGATSSATNNNPCILDGTNPLPSDQTIGEWEVDEDGNGTLSADNPLGARYALQAGTMSIRQVQHDFSAATALPVNPLSYTLVACGEVQRVELLDPVTDLVPGLPKFPSVPPLS
ncbi:hypothetical protein ACVGOW_22090 [Pseudonocardia saturnea]